MKTWTETIGIAAPARRVFDFVSDGANLPRWAVEFCKEARREDGAWRLRTAQGECTMRIAADAASGVVDFHMSPGGTAFSRVVDAGAGTEYLFTFAGDASMDAALRKELAVLKSLLEG
jgi:hypothetical protein